MSVPSEDKDMNLLEKLVGKHRPARTGGPSSADAESQAREKDLSNTVDAIRLLVEVDPPEGLVSATMRRIEDAKLDRAISAGQELSRVSWPVVSWAELVAATVAAMLLLAIIIPSVQSANRRSVRGACMSQMGQIGSALLSYSIDNRDRLPCGSTGTTRWLPGQGQQAGSNSCGLYRLITGGYVQPAAFLCPAVGGEETLARSDSGDFQSPRQISYSYQHSMGRPGIATHSRTFSGMTDRMAIMADSSPVFPGGRFDPQKARSARSANHDGMGQNILYLDWHVAWSDSPDAGVHNNNIYLAEGVTDYQGNETPANDYDSFLLPDFVQTATLRK